MFYEQVVLARKGPLGHVWLAAHWEKKLTKQHVSETNIPETVDRIKNPRAPMALRLSGHLLLGVVRIYHRKVDFLYTDCNDALGKIKQAFRPDRTELDDRVANIRSITMPETIADIAVMLPGDIASQQLPEAGEDLMTFNLTQAAEIGGTQEDIEIARRSRRPEAEREPASQLEFPRLGSENDLIDPNVQLDFGLEDMGVPDISRPEEGFEAPGFDTNELMAGWGEEPRAGPIELPAREEIARGLKKRPIVDKSTEISGKAMERLLNDPSTLYRPIRMAPPTRELIDARRRELEFGLDGLFDEPLLTGLPPQLTALLRISKAVGLGPQGPFEELSIESARGGEAEIAPVYEEPGFEYEGGDYRESRAESDRLSSIEASEEEVGEIATQGKGFVITKRTAEMHQFLAKQFKEAGRNVPLSFFNIFQSANRRRAAVAFFELLNIKSKGCINVKQASSYEDILITKTKEFEKLTT